jgi:hypothetical protein
VRDHSYTLAIRTPGLRVLVATFVAAGAIFGALDVAMVAFAGQVGSRSRRDSTGRSRR